jgi:hypothetical protein
MAQNKKTSGNSREPEVLPDVATNARRSILVEPVAESGPERVAKKLKTGKRASPKDRLETRPPGNLPTPLNPAGPSARGYPADPKVEGSNDDDIGHSI